MTHEAGAGLPPPPQLLEVFGGHAAFEAERAFGERVAGPDGDNELIAADETVADVRKRRPTGAGFEVHRTPS